MSSTPHTQSDDTSTGGDCDLGAIDDLACSATGIKRQAEKTEQQLPRLTEFKDKFNSARADYTKARETAGADAEAADKTLKQVYEQLRCRIGAEEKHCLKEAVKQVFAEIRDCAGGWGCCADECDCKFDPSVGDEDTVASLAARIARYEAQVEREAACFTALAGEKDALTQRAAKIKADALQLLAEIAEPGKNVIRLWAQLLVLRKRLTGLYHGFGSVSEYMDCLCKVLLCVLKGSSAVAVLEGAKAKLECMDALKKKACEEKQTNTVDEVMEVYERLCRQCPPKGTVDEGSAEEDEEDEEWEEGKADWPGSRAIAVESSD
ncbi:hypothetical protein [Streptomyces sp. AP-93]|uniref:hypothetical protein n=1 Tax=Streptomyces sp. AP-93 TaxID=2929048 RepID=UPI001FAEF914|nr:hypothetical protein [Streptomyces sp. AP-93]MCJ0874264.1 hypothetical protein [Streptomyces sp. AP-93]